MRRMGRGSGGRAGHTPALLLLLLLLLGLNAAAPILPLGGDLTLDLSHTLYNHTQYSSPILNFLFPNTFPVEYDMFNVKICKFYKFLE